MAHERRPTARPPTTQQILNEQTREAERERAQPTPTPSTGTAIAKAPAPSLPAKMPADTRISVQKYLDTIAPASLIGRRVSGTKEYPFVTPHDGERIPDSDDFVAHCEGTLVGHIRFNGQGMPPDYRMGELYGGYVVTETEDLPDRDQTKWEIGLDGRPADPWPHFNYLPLHRDRTDEWFTFATSSKTGRRAVGNLLRHFDRLRRTHPDTLPIVRLRAGGFNHRDPKIGWVTVPVFQIVGRVAADSTAKPYSSLQADLNDDVPF
jgi:hypothetical protein